ncbi:MAG TPA: hypothetical protein VN922_13070 [Bacteroidia bacterium]|nr:hypothetical protein [Bacteroidia bacterium]
MSKYLITYHNGGMPSDPKAMEQAKMAFGKWLQESGKAIVDPGAPVMAVKQVTSSSAPKVEIGGYSIIEAASDDEATNILKTHPFVSRGGTLQVNKIMAV